MSDVIHTATNFRVDRETQLLGEDAPVVCMIADSFRTLQQSVESARFLVTSKRAADMLRELELGLSDLRSDACVASTAALALEAYEEAKVVPIKRPGAPALRVVK